MKFTVMQCDICRLRHEAPEPPIGWMWTQRHDKTAESYDLCADCVAKIFKAQRLALNAKFKVAPEDVMKRENRVLADMSREINELRIALAEMVEAQSMNNVGIGASRRRLEAIKHARAVLEIQNETELVY